MNKCVGSLSNLQFLGLSKNSLSGTLPSELGSLSNLQKLYLYNNSLSGTIPDSINALSVKKGLENPPCGNSNFRQPRNIGFCLGTYYPGHNFPDLTRASVH
ncbi:MAG: hypothetical protein EBE86_033275 [Hormoscilla sp. GUM202]|nr:hypothetical protein [Hormoscilla sp. GUM202]